MIKDENQKHWQQNELDELTYIISHDLQEPLRMITSYVQLLKRKYSEKLDENAKDYIDFAVQGSERLKQMMDSLLTYSRIGRLEVKTRKVKLKKVLEKSVKQLKSEYKEKDFHITDNFDEKELVTNDDLLTKLFYHIIDNALKFNYNDIPFVDIRIDGTTDEDLISVSDNGMGIDKEYHGKIFGIFQKLHNQNEYPGTGMGLAISEKIVNTLGGTIRIDSEKGNGAVFTLSFKKDFKDKTEF